MISLVIAFSLAVSKKNINDELNSIENKLKETRSLIYKAFTPRIKHLPDLNLLDVTDRVDKAKRKRATKTVSEIMKESPILPKSTSSITSVSPLPEFSNSESHDVVALREVI